MSATHAYTISTDFPGGKANESNLKDEISLSGITIALDYISVVGDTITIVFKAVLPSADKTILDGDTTNPAGGLIASHNSTTKSSVPSVQILEESGTQRTGGHFQAMSRKFSAPSNRTTTVDFSEPIPMAGFILNFKATTEHEGDVINMYVAPETIVGAITANVSVSDTVINVSSTVLQNMSVGFLFQLFDGVHTEDLGRVITIDKANGQITVENASTRAFSASSPTYVRQSIQYVRDYIIGPPGDYTVGQSKIGGTYIPANTVIRVTYENKSLLISKSFVAYSDQTY